MSTIRARLVAGSRLRDLVEDGVRAVERAHLRLIEEDIRSSFDDSVDIDMAFAKGHEQENRWDYLLGHTDSERIVALEPHSAHNKEISTVIKKREASLRHLRDHLKPGMFVAEWFWVASGKVDFMPMDKAMIRLTENGIKFVGKALLAKALPVATAATGVRKPGKRKRSR